MEMFQRVVRGLQHSLVREQTSHNDTKGGLEFMTKEVEELRKENTKLRGRVESSERVLKEREHQINTITKQRLQEQVINGRVQISAPCLYRIGMGTGSSSIEH